MKKWLFLLIFALLLHAGCVRAEEIYYTNNKDIYYHTDPDCDRPDTKLWWTDAEREVFARACYEKYPISEEAAQAFDRKACPICVKRLEPVYLGEHMMEWEYDYAPWGLGDRMRVWGEEAMGSKEYQAEVSDTLERFEAYYEEVYDRKTHTSSRKHPYPDSFAGLWANNSDSISYAVVDPTQEILDRFKELFGGGAWIVPAKYGENEMRALQDQIFDVLNRWIAEHPELDIHPASASVTVTNELEVGMYGEDWEEALSMIDAELDLPIWVCFTWGEPATAVDF